MNKIKERGMKIVFMVAACASVLAVFLICLFLFASGIPAIGKIGPLEFLFGTEWRPSNDLYGIFPMIVASIYVTGSNSGRSSRSSAYVCIYGPLLSEKYLQTVKIRY